MRAPRPPRSRSQRCRVRERARQPRPGSPGVFRGRAVGPGRAAPSRSPIRDPRNSWTVPSKYYIHGRNRTRIGRRARACSRRHQQGSTRDGSIRSHDHRRGRRRALPRPRLKLDRIRTQVFERDASRTSPVEGYRLSISASGGKALKSCLPRKVFEKFIRNTGEPSRAVTFLDHKLNRLLAIDFPHSDRLSDESERPVGPAALRRVLLDGLDDIVHFGKRFVAYEREADGRMTAHFADGARATADLLVG